MKRKFTFFTEAVLTLLTYVLFPGWLFVVHAGGEDKNFEVGINLETLRLPLFLPFDPQFAESATVFSWLSFIGIILTVALIVFWIYLILRAAVKAMQSKGESEGLEEASKRFRSIFIGMFITFLFPIILSVIGILIGIGSIFQWPKMFSQCGEGLSAEYQYYFQAYLDIGEEADAACGFT